MDKRYWFSLIVIILQLMAAFYLSSYIPAGKSIPTHWNMRGEIDQYSEKWVGLYLFPLINLFILGIMLVLPVISPRYKHAPERFAKMIPVLTNILVFFFAAIHLFSMLIAAELVAMTSSILFYLLGFMFILLGNILPKFPSSFYIGVRTPWTLSSEKVWRKTHKLAGVCFILGGLLMIVMPTIWKNNPTANIVMFVLFITIVLLPVLYSFIWFKKEEKK